MKTLNHLDDQQSSEAATQLYDSQADDALPLAFTPINTEDSVSNDEAEDIDTGDNKDIEDDKSDQEADAGELLTPRLCSCSLTITKDI